MTVFTDRVRAGRQLAGQLSQLRGQDCVILGMARGGVAVGFGIAEELTLPLHALVVRKVGAPHNPELAVGAVSETGEQVLDLALVRATGATEEYLRREINEQVDEARRRQAEYRTGEGLSSVQGRIAVIADDGIATGASALVAVRSARDLGASAVILAAPVAARQAVDLLRPEVDSLVVLLTPEPFIAVGQYYQNFNQVTDGEVLDYLARASRIGHEARL